MANFSTALEALGANRVSLDVISYQLRQILDNTPDYSQYLLSHLLKAKENDVIDTSDYQHLRQIIEPYLLDEHPISVNSDESDLPNFKTVHITQELNTDSVIKQRFKLLEILGVGGMGRVYKGIDLLKQEARDKNPYVALKLLNEDFKSHPQAFISLQRESSRQQKLAHPNIATVYDFDRVGGPGTPVFITMELLEGQTLNTFIKTKLRRIGGLPFSEAFKIIKQLASALSYAHERGIVHSDFKPGNAFICNDGTVKTLDFGIARAVKNPIDGVSERTLFDPRNLGAFTPAYASMEMLLGKAPDTRDDIYALGCVTYELLTGKHPFNKLPATKVKETKLIPEPIKGLKRKQNQTIQRALACHREDRCQTVEEFVHDLEAKYVWYKDTKTIAAGLVLILASALYFPVNNYLKQQNIQTITSELKSGDHDLIEKKLIELIHLDKIQQLNIANNARETIQSYFRQKINSLTNIESDGYDFLKADKLLQTIQDIYPDSSFYLELKENTELKKKEVLSQLYDKINNNIVTVDDATDLYDTLNNIKLRIDPKHTILSDSNVSENFHELSKSLFLNNNTTQASQVLNYGLDFFPDNNPLLDVKKQINNEKLLETVKLNLEKLTLDSAELSDYLPYQDDIQTLAKLEADGFLLSELTENFRILIRNSMQSISEAVNTNDAKAIYEQYKGILSSLELNDEIIELQMLNLGNDSRKQLAETIHQENITALNSLLDKPDVENPDWQNDVSNHLSILSIIDIYIANSVKISDLEKQIADIFINQVTTATKNKYFDRAKYYLNMAKNYSDDTLYLNEIENEIQTALTNHKNEKELAVIKKEFEVVVAANKLSSAMELYEKLKTISTENDYYIDTFAPKRLAESFQWHAKQEFSNGEYQKALELADNGLDYYAFTKNLNNERDQYLVESHAQYLSNIFQGSTEFDDDDIRRKFGEIENINPSRYLELRQATTDVLLDRINSLKESDINQATILAQNANTIFPGGAISQLLQNLKPEPWPDSELAKTLANDRRLTAAINLQQSISDEYRDHPDFVLFSQIITEQTDLANDAFKAFLKKKDVAGEDEEKLIAAQLQLQQARSIWTDNPDYLTADNEIKKIIRTLQKNNSPIVLQPEKTNFQPQTAQSEPEQLKQQTETWKPISSGRECQQRFASYGKRAKAVCFDLVNNNWRGPLMVVVPPGEQQVRHFAISKYEISINDYSKYCALSGHCLPETNEDKQNSPMRNISLAEAKSYTDWLSERTGKQYRLPTKSEWRHAALAAGKQPEKDFNCRVAMGDKVIKGADIISVKSGQSNGWGLKNYIGNVQEWVQDNGAVYAMGGAYSDTFSKCDIKLERSHTGKADDITGFRIVLTDIIEQ